MVGNTIRGVSAELGSERRLGALRNGLKGRETVDAKEGGSSVSCVAGAESTVRTAPRPEAVHEFHTMPRTLDLMCQEIKGKQPVEQRCGGDN